MRSRTSLPVTGYAVVGRRSSSPSRPPQRLRTGSRGAACGRGGRPRRRRPPARSRPRTRRTRRPPHRHLAISEDRAGGVRIRGRGTAEDGALLKAALLPLTVPDPTVDPETGEQFPDPRDHGTRMWDALVTTAQHALATDLPPQTHATPARLIVTVDHQTLKQALNAHGSAARPPTAPTSHPTSSAVWPATPRSSPPSSAPAARSSTSDDSTAWSHPRSGPPWSSATGTAPSPPAPDHP